jgi:hypothetical protein
MIYGHQRCRRIKMNYVHPMLVFLIIIITVGNASAVVSPSDLQNVVFSDDRGSTNEASHGHVTYNLVEGWNLVPLAFMYESSGRYWANHKEGRSCSQDIFQNVWYYSPVLKDYYHIPVMDDWASPVSRNNDLLLNEFKGKYYHVFSGSGWVYSPSDCILEGDSGTQLFADSYGSSELRPGYNKKELVLKSGWNFVPLDMHMAVYEKSLKELFASCQATRFYTYDPKSRKWVDASPEVSAGKKIPFADIFKTYVVKTSRDCNFADFSEASKSAPPTLPPQ